MGGDDLLVLINGNPFTGWKTTKVQQSFDEAAGTCTVGMSELPGGRMPARLGDTLQVIAAGRSVLKGYVHEINGGHEWQDHTIEIHGRDQTQDFVDSTVGPNLPKMKPPIDLKTVLKQTLDTMGLSAIGVIDKVNPPKFQPGEVIDAPIDMKGHTFGDAWAQKRQTLLTTDGEGNLVIDRNQKRRLAAFLHKGLEDDPLNNILKDTYKDSDLDQHNTVACSSQKSTNDKDYLESRPKDDPPWQSDPIQKKWGKGVDSSIRSERRLHFRGRQGVDGETPEKAAKWRSSVARGRGFQYTATVQGFTTPSRELWWPGFIVPVFSIVWDIADELLISSVEFTKDWDGGSMTLITCSAGDSFSEEAGAAPSRTAKRGLGQSPPGRFPPANLGF